MTTRRVKLVLNEVLSLVNTVGIIILLFLVMHLIVQLNQTLVTAHAQTEKAVKQIQGSEKTQIGILRCQFILFGRDRTAVVTVEQLDECLKGTDFDSSSTSTKPATTSIGTTTTPTVKTNGVIVPQASSTDNPTSTQPTTSAPPDPTSPTPTLLEQILKTTSPAVDNIIKKTERLY